MTRRRWIADELAGNRAALVGEHAAHLARVLRAQIGQEFDISAGDDLRRGRIVSISEKRVEFEVGEIVPAAATDEITMVLAIFKFDRMEWAIEKCTELGAAKIVPVTARRTDAHLATAAARRVERWRRIARQAAEQSRRVKPPEIADPTQLKDVLTMSSSGHEVLLAEFGADTPLRDVENISALAVGPEGGWTEAEHEMFGKAGWIPASLGPTILRAETAAIAALAVVMSTV